MEKEARGVNVKKDSAEYIGFAEKWNAAHVGREERQESIKVVMERWSKFISDESVASAMKYLPRDGDVFIATHSKAGTTMMQQIVHQLRSKGDTEFGEISLTVPWLEMSGDLGVDLNQEQDFSPRAFKTHFDWPSVPKTFDEKGTPISKYIYIVRNPISIIVSIYYFLLDWFYTEEEFHFCDLVELMLYKRSTPIWAHYKEWFEASKKYKDQILWVFFEDMVNERETVVREVAKFIGLSGGDVEERINIAIEYSSFDWMKKNENLFDEAPSKKARNEAFGAVGNKACKIRTGKTTVSSMEPLLREEIETQVWSKFEEEFGVKNYEQFRSLVFSSSAQTIEISK